MGLPRHELHARPQRIGDSSLWAAVVSLDTSEDQGGEMWQIHTELWIVELEGGRARRLSSTPTLQGVPIGSEGTARDSYDIRLQRFEDLDGDGDVEIMLVALVGFSSLCGEDRTLRVYDVFPTLRVAADLRLSSCELQEDAGTSVTIQRRGATTWEDVNGDGHSDIRLRERVQHCEDDCQQVAMERSEYVWRADTDAWVRVEP